MSKSHFQGSSADAAGPDPEVLAQGPGRRNYTAAYKLRVLAQAEALAGKGGGEVGAFLRKEGIYSSHLSHWRKQKAQGLLGERKRGKAGKDRDASVKEVLLLTPVRMDQATARPRHCPRHGTPVPFFGRLSGRGHVPVTLPARILIHAHRSKRRLAAAEKRAAQAEFLVDLQK